MKKPAKTIVPVTWATLFGKAAAQPGNRPGRGKSARVKPAAKKPPLRVTGWGAAGGSGAAVKKPAAKKKTAAKKAKKHPRRQLALGEGVACCSAEALAASLRLAGRPVSDEDVLALYWRTAADADAGASILATLEAAAEFGLAGVRLRRAVPLGEDFADDPEFASMRRVFSEFTDQPEQQPAVWPEPLAVADPAMPPFGMLPSLFEFAARDRQEHGRAEFAATPAGVAGVADLDVEPVGREVADGRRDGRGELKQGHLCHGTSTPAMVAAFNQAPGGRVVRSAPQRAAGDARCTRTSPRESVASRTVRTVRDRIVTIPGVSLILGVELPGPHAVLATADGWWSWGELYDPAVFPDAVIEEAWEVTWPVIR